MLGARGEIRTHTVRILSATPPGHLGYPSNWCPWSDSNRHCRETRSRASWPFGLHGRDGARGPTRTDTERGLNPLPLPIGLHALIFSVVQASEHQARDARSFAISDLAVVTIERKCGRDEPRSYSNEIGQGDWI
jgi:hypothetical protein